jgi:protein SCO1/2
MSRAVAPVAALVLALGAALARADVGPADQRPPLLADVGLVPRLGNPVPLDAIFRDESGTPAPLGRWVEGTRPALLTLVYYGCPMLCSQVLKSLATSLRAVGLEPGKDFDLVTVSFDPRDQPETARARKAEVVAHYGRPGGAAGWHFLTGDADAIARLTEAVGFRYAWDDAGKQFAHVALVTVLTPDGRIARYLSGIEYPARDVRLALVEASEGRVGSVADRVRLFCYRYDSATGRYTPAVERALQVGCVLTAAALGTLIVVLRRRESTA